MITIISLKVAQIGLIQINTVNEPVSISVLKMFPNFLCLATHFLALFVGYRYFIYSVLSQRTAHSTMLSQAETHPTSAKLSTGRELGGFKTRANALGVKCRIRHAQYERAPVSNHQGCGAEIIFFRSGSDFQKVSAPAPEPAPAPTLALRVPVFTAFK
jgi:hypothetical protein